MDCKTASAHPVRFMFGVCSEGSLDGMVEVVCGDEKKTRRSSTIEHCKVLCFTVLSVYEIRLTGLGNTETGYFRYRRAMTRESCKAERNVMFLMRGPPSHR